MNFNKYLYASIAAFDHGYLYSVLDIFTSLIWPFDLHQEQWWSRIIQILILVQIGFQFNVQVFLSLIIKVS